MPKELRTDLPPLPCDQVEEMKIVEDIVIQKEVKPFLIEKGAAEVSKRLGNKPAV